MQACSPCECQCRGGTCCKPRWTHPAVRSGSPDAIGAGAASLGEMGPGGGRGLWAWAFGAWDEIEERTEAGQSSQRRASGEWGVAGRAADYITQAGGRRGRAHQPHRPQMVLSSQLAGIAAAGISTWQVLLSWYRFRTKNEFRQDDASLFQVSLASLSSLTLPSLRISRRLPAFTGTGRCNRERQGQPQGSPQGRLRLCGGGQRARPHLR